MLKDEFVTLCDSTLAVSYYNTVTGESWEYNADRRFHAASLYKLPLNMIYSELFYDGILSDDYTLCGYTYDSLQEYSLVYSSNEISVMLQNEVGKYADVAEKLTEMCGTGETVPETCLTNRLFSANEMMGILKKLYYDEGLYPGVVDCMLRAQPDSFFRYYEDRYDIAQKYGSYEGCMNTVGIVYMPTPYLLVVMTDLSVGSNHLIGLICRIMTEYTLSREPEPAPSPPTVSTAQPSPTPGFVDSERGSETRNTQEETSGKSAWPVLAAAAFGIAAVAALAVVQSSKSRRQ